MTDQARDIPSALYAVNKDKWWEAVRAYRELRHMLSNSRGWVSVSKADRMTALLDQVCDAACDAVGGVPFEDAGPGRPYR